MVRLLWLTQKDQIELVEKDIEGGFKFSVVRHRLSGGEQRGTLVVGVTALTFLNKDSKIVFCHPYRTVRKYCVNKLGQVEYTLEIDRGKSLVYTFDSAEAASVISAIDKHSLMLEKVLSEKDQDKKAAPLFDEEGMAAASGTSAPIMGPRMKMQDVPGMRFNVRVKREDGEQRVVAIINQEGISLVDPSVEKGGANVVAYQKFPFHSILSTSVSEKSLVINTSTGPTHLITPDAHSLLAEINQQAQAAGSVNLDAEDKDSDKIAYNVANAARAVVIRADPKENPDLYAVASFDYDGLKSKAFAAGAFKALRKAWGISEEEFSDEWNPSHNPRRVEVTPGIKGSWVVFSKSRRFVALELEKSESTLFGKSAEQYCKYVQDNPKSLLMRIVGHFQADSTHFVVYVHPVPPLAPAVTVTYDLHGGGDRVAPAVARGRATSHLLDKDFTLDHRTVFTSYREKKAMLLQIAQDNAFLAKLGFVDYVLQVTVAAFEESLLGAVKAWLQSARERPLYPGMFLSPLEDEVFCVAITHVCVKEGADKGYGQMLYDFAKRRVVTSPDPKPADLEWEKALLEKASAQGIQPPKSPRGGAI